MSKGWYSLEAWSHGFFQDIRSLMKTIGQESITIQDVEEMIATKERQTIWKTKQREDCPGCGKKNIPKQKIKPRGSARVAQREALEDSWNTTETTLKRR